MSELDKIADQDILDGDVDIYRATGASVGLAVALHGALCELHALGRDDLFEKIRTESKKSAAQADHQGGVDFNVRRANEAALDAIDRAVDRTKAAIQRGKLAK